MLLASSYQVIKIKKLVIETPNGRSMARRNIEELDGVENFLTRQQAAGKSARCAERAENLRGSWRRSIGPAAVAGR
jgi:hypothetical protein